MNNTKKLAVAVLILAGAGLSGCASTQVAERSAASAATAEPHQVSRPAPTYGSMGGYRYRRFVAVDASAS